MMNGERPTVKRKIRVRLNGIITVCDEFGGLPELGSTGCNTKFVSVQKRATDEHGWTQILRAGFGISYAFLRVTVR